MRKRIAVFLGELGREFQREFCDVVRKTANAKGYDVFLFNNFGSYANTFLFDVGEKFVCKIPVLSEYSGIILLPDTFDIDGMDEMVLQKVREEANCPVVSVRNGSDDTYRIVIDDYATSYNLTDHFIKEHGYKKICYMSGPLSSEDAMNRYNGYLDAMRDNGLVPLDEAFFEGDFWTIRCKDAAAKFMKAYDGKPDAILFANDYMLIGTCEELKKNGIRIPQDIAVAGYDEIIEGKRYQPPLTTVRMPTEEMALKAMSIIEDVNAGIDVPMRTSLQGEILIKGSCGCNPDMPSEDISAWINKMSDGYINLRTASFITADVQNHIKEEEKLAFISGFVERFYFDRVYICLTQNAGDSINPYSDEMILRAVLPIDDEYNKKPQIGQPFDRRLIIPEEVYDSSKPTTFIVLTIHHKNTTFGYVAMEWNDKDFTMFIAPFMSALALAYDDLRMQQQFTELIEIKKLNFRDSLTGVSNRRGFEQNLANLISSKTLTTDIISFVSADIDNLSEINDTYGHYEGDSAICLFADVLKTVTDSNDIFARVGEDEFYVVLTSSDRSIHDNFIRTVHEELEHRNSTEGNDFDVRASLGICTINSSDIGNAFEHLQIADKRMLEAKMRNKD